MTLPVTRSLLEGIVDYAGLFPPAGLHMAATVANYERYLRDDHAWMLGRLVVAVARLEEFTDTAGGIEGVETWRLSAVAGEDHPGDLERIETFNRGGGPVIDMVELRVGDPGEVADIAERAGVATRVFVEIPVDGDPREFVRAIAASRLRAKIRTGGVTPDAFPSADQVARFIRTCYSAGVAFKATAGLHHPFRGEYDLTYEPDSPRTVTHGFLNVFLTAAFCYNGIGAVDARRLLQASDIGELTFDNAGVAWDQYRLDAAEVATARKRLAVSFGSCSFTEPIDDLTRLELI